MLPPTEVRAVLERGEAPVSFSTEAGEVFIIGIGGFNASEGSYVITID
jgi:hypothetical protein